LPEDEAIRVSLDMSEKMHVADGVSRDAETVESLFPSGAELRYIAGSFDNRSKLFDLTKAPFDRHVAEEDSSIARGQLEQSKAEHQQARIKACPSEDHICYKLG
jgi:hypothetical protein